MSEQVLQRFHRVLVDALRRRDPEHLSRPFTVAEIYQDLVPYSANREALGVEMNGDYEHALLRLLAGEGDYLEMESEHALREIQEELESVNPNTGLYREFAAVDVRLNPSRVPAPGDEGVHAQALAEPVSTEDDEVADAAADVDEAGPSDGDFIQNVPLGAFASVIPLDPEMVEPEPETEAVSRSTSVPDVCRWCRETLPKRDNLNFCPFCGTDVKLVPCVSCGEALEPEWRFCIACGTRSPED